LDKTEIAAKLHEFNVRNQMLTPIAPSYKLSSSYGTGSDAEMVDIICGTESGPNHHYLGSLWLASRVTKEVVRLALKRCLEWYEDIGIVVDSRIWKWYGSYRILCLSFFPTSSSSTIFQTFLITFPPARCPPGQSLLNSHHPRLFFLYHSLPLH
jgi:hypothetical protein